VRILACEVLAKLRDERAVDSLVQALGDQAMRWAAVAALARIGSEQALQPLVKVLSDPRKEVRLEVVKALGAFTDKRLIVVLKRVTEVEPTTEVRTRAQEVMRDMARRLDLEAAGDERETAAASFDHLTTSLDRLLAIARRMDASDLHLSAGEPPYLRIHGRLERVEEGRVLESAEVPRRRGRHHVGARRAGDADPGQIDFCHLVPEVGRYRANVFRGRRGWSAVFHVIHNIPRRSRRSTCRRSSRRSRAIVTGSSSWRDRRLGEELDARGARQSARRVGWPHRHARRSGRVRAPHEILARRSA
jgi:hypothetical protein